MTEKLLMCPIIVNENYEIIDGQHRYSASKELGLPIRYIVGEGYGSAGGIERTCGKRFSDKFVLSRICFVYQKIFSRTCSVCVSQSFTDGNHREVHKRHRQRRKSYFHRSVYCEKGGSAIGERQALR